MFGSLVHPLEDNRQSLTIPSSLNANEARILILKEIYEIPMISEAVRLMRFWGFIFCDIWSIVRRGFALSVIITLISMQLCWLFTNDDSMEFVIEHSYMMILWMNTIFRPFLILYDMKDYEKFLLEFIDLYKEIFNSEDAYIRGMLRKANKLAKTVARFNMILASVSVSSVIGSGLFSGKRLLPYAGHIPGLNVLQSPVYEIVYVYQLVISPFGAILYIPYGCIVVSLIMFATLMCRVLEHRIRSIRNEKHIDVMSESLIWCIKYQKTIIRYIAIINNLATYVFLIEFLAFGALLCILLFRLNFATTSSQFAISGTHIVMIFSQIFSLYYFANELSTATSRIAEAAYDLEWFNCPNDMQKMVLLLILRAQKECHIYVGNIYPMSLEMFQSLLNTSYSYFTILRRFNE